MPWLTQIGGEVVAGPAAEFGRLIDSEAGRWAQVARFAKVQQ